MNKINKLLTILLLIILASCEDNPRCIDGIDFGNPKAVFDEQGNSVYLRFPENKYASWFQQSWASSTPFVLNGDSLVMEIKGAWTPWGELIDNTPFFNNLYPGDAACGVNWTVNCDNKEANQVCDMDDFTEVSEDLSRVEPNNHRKICWFTKGIGAYVAFSEGQKDSRTVFYHVGDPNYFTTNYLGRNGWFFTLSTSDVQNILADLGVASDTPGRVRIYTYIKDYNYRGNVSGCVANDASGVALIDPDDGEVTKCDSPMQGTFHKGATAVQASYLSNLYDVILKPAETFIKNIYSGIIESDTFKGIFTAMLTIFISYLGIAYSLGLTNFSSKDLLPIILRLGLAYTMLSPSLGWQWYEQYVVVAFWEGSQELASFVMDSFYTAAMGHGEFFSSDDALYFSYGFDANVFQTIDQFLGILFSSEMHIKIISIIFSNPLGLLIAVLMYAIIFLAIVALLKFSVSLFTVFMTMMILLSIGPILFVLLLFGYTRKFFMQWINLLLGLALQPMMFLAFLGIFLSTITFYLWKLLYIQACFKTLFTFFGLFDIGWWHVSKQYLWDTSLNAFVEHGKYTFQFTDAIVLVALAIILKYFADMVPRVADKIAGGIDITTAASGVYGMVDKLAETGGKTAVKIGAAAPKHMSKIAITNVGLGLSAAGLKTPAKYIKGTREHDFRKAKSEIKRKLRVEGLTDSEIKARFKDPHSDERRQLKQEYMSRRARSEAERTLMGGIKSVAKNINEDGFIKTAIKATDKGRKFVMGKGSEAFQESLQKKYMTKEQRKRQKEALSGSGHYRKARMADEQFQKEADEFLDVKFGTRSKAQIREEREKDKKRKGKGGSASAADGDLSEKIRAARERMRRTPAGSSRSSSTAGGEEGKKAREERLRRALKKKKK